MNAFTNIVTTVLWILFSLLVGGGLIFLLSCIINLNNRSNEETAESRWHNEEQALCDERKKILAAGLSRPNRQLSPSEWKRYHKLGG